jgi:hypothetical protein
MIGKFDRYSAASVYFAGNERGRGWAGCLCWPTQVGLLNQEQR